MTHPWMCDAMGHVNTRHIVGLFDDASYRLLIDLAGPTPPADLGWADVRCQIDYRDEIRAGTAVDVISTITAIGTKSLTYAHVMVDALTQGVKAEATVVSVRFDLAARKAVPLEADLRRRAETFGA
ncbi:acyl-CoA thioesterase [Siculibacillus lacustris]|uniref:Acyl-CoA thioesterase n=1 Tax=Siculibacillus lacustris TaxID=1549641 RepID=A0A4Q9VVI2_9HYPH|nr:acyl-CoA thioesterase [Siculibacillus lacustris]TBW40267.1 acyl-CoA thioesterase [Siculibacillus lacustris]